MFNLKKCSPAYSKSVFLHEEEYKNSGCIMPALLDRSTEIDVLSTANNYKQNIGDAWINRAGDQGNSLLQQSLARRSRNFMINAISVSVLMTAILLFMNTFPAILKLIVFCGSLITGLIIEFMLNGDKYE